MSKIILLFTSLVNLAWWFYFQTSLNLWVSGFVAGILVAIVINSAQQSVERTGEQLG